MFLKDTSYKRVLIWTIVASFPIYISPLMLVTGLNRKLGISDQVFVLSGGFLVEAVAELQLLPLLVLTAKISPPGLEASIYAVMMSIRNFGGAVSKANSALAVHFMGISATNFNGLAMYIFICGLFLLVPLAFYKLLPGDEEIEAIKRLNQGEEGLNLVDMDIEQSLTSSDSSKRGSGSTS
eukprot:Selendium_serpulae@DN7890_c0_g1_i2.p1